ncbi:cadherin-like protein 26 [Tiliqua scincoides]|uniref:cadherin-like protein 26 n=1 Tax=Tiliqua scincoides TaxID=71010 RepID=UPI0034637E4D
MWVLQENLPENLVGESFRRVLQETPQESPSGEPTSFHSPGATLEVFWLSHDVCIERRLTFKRKVSASIRRNPREGGASRCRSARARVLCAHKRRRGAAIRRSGEMLPASASFFPAEGRPRLVRAALLLLLVRAEGWRGRGASGCPSGQVRPWPQQGRRESVCRLQPRVPQARSAGTEGGAHSADAQRHFQSQAGPGLAPEASLRGAKGEMTPTHCASVWQGGSPGDPSWAALVEPQKSPTGSTPVGLVQMTLGCVDRVQAVKDAGGLEPNLQDSLRPLRRTKRRWVITTLEFQEESKGPFPMFVGELFNNVSYNVSLKYLISGHGVDEYPEFGLFSIEDDASGRIYVHRPVDRENTPFFMIRFDVADRKTGVIVDRSLFFNIKIKDINDNSPEFLKKEFNITVKENHKRDEPVFNVTAYDKDENGTANSRVAYSLLSQTPRLKEPIFTVNSFSGLIYISGCSDYETARTFKLLIRATDHGDPPRSSTATVNVAMEDSNFNLPVFTQENYLVNIPEGKTAHDILRLSVEDKDSPNTPAWRAKYQIVRGNEKENFIIQTDPDTNEGILSIVKPLIYDGTSERKLVISVENEELLFTCYRGQVRSHPISPRKASVSINVTDGNNAPEFTPSVLLFHQEEELLPGTFLVQYTATDLDIPPNAIRYRVASDPEGWVTINENSGIVMTRKKVDKDAPDVNNSIYNIVIHAIDDGLPPLTGTGTIQLHVYDINDNPPMLVTSALEICYGKGKGPFLIQAEDRDSHPFAEPFIFELDETLQNGKNFWNLGKNFGDSVELWMVKSLPPGDYSVPLQIFDMQGLSRQQTLNVTVCPCMSGVSCEQARSSSSVSLGGGGLAAILSAFLLLLLGVGLLLWCSCRFQTKKESPYIPYQEGNQTLVHYNEESQHTLSQDDHAMSLGKPTECCPKRKKVLPIAIPEDAQPIFVWDQQRPLYPQISGTVLTKPRDRIVETAGKILNQKLQQIINSEDYNAFDSLHVYAEEREMEKSDSFWSLPVSVDDSSLPPDFLDTLGPKFSTLDKIISK